MYTTIILYLESLKKRFTTESNVLGLNCWWKENMQLKVATSAQQLKKKLAKRMVELSTLWNNNFVKILKWADH